MATSPSAGLGDVTHELKKLHELARDRTVSEQQQRIEDLTREVRHLRETVARLRGSSMSQVPLSPSLH